MKQYEHFQKNLKDYKVTVDKDKLWANTLHAIPKKRKRRGAFIFLLAGILTMAGGLFWITNQNTIKTPSNAQSAIDSSSDTKGTSAIASKDIPADTQSTYNLSSNLLDVKTNKRSSLSTTKHADLHKINSSTPKSSLNSNQRKTIDSRSTTETISSEIALEDLHESVHLQPDNKEEQAVLISTNDNSNSEPSSENLSLPQPSAADINQSLSAIENPDQPIHEEMLLVRTINKPADEINSLPINHQLNLNEQDRENQPPVIPAKRQKMNSPFSLQIMQGLGWSTFSMSVTDPELTQTMDNWQPRITSLENLTTSLQTTIRLPKGIQVGAGLQYSKLATQLEYSTSSSAYFTTSGITAIVIGVDGSMENVYGDIDVLRETYTRSIRYTYHHRLDAEVMLQVPLYSTLRTSINAWIKGGINLYYAAEGTTFDQDDKLVRFDSDTNPYSLASPFTFGGGLSASYRINPVWSIQVRAGYEQLRYTHGLFDDHIQFNHHLYSLALGAAYQF